MHPLRAALDMTTPRSAVTWRYIPGRNVKHALVLEPRSVSGHRRYALCGASPVWFRPADEEWHGTGSQVEYETAERLRECRRCARLLEPAAVPGG